MFALGRFGHKNRRGAQQAVLKLVTLAHLGHDLTFRMFVRFVMPQRLVPVGIEWFSDSVDGLDPGIAQDLPELRQHCLLYTSRCV